MIEIELKAYYNPIKVIESEVIKRGGVFRWEKHQTDIYFNTPHKDLRQTNEYLRTREFSDGAGILAFHRNIERGITEETEIKVNDIKKTIKIFEELDFIKLGVIDKLRRAYRYKKFDIFFDEVKDMGNFIEIELMVEAKERMKEKREECREELISLGIPEENITKIWLSDIGVGRMKPLEEWLK